MNLKCQKYLPKICCFSSQAEVVGLEAEFYQVKGVKQSNHYFRQIEFAFVMVNLFQVIIEVISIKLPTSWFGLNFIEYSLLRLRDPKYLSNSRISVLQAFLFSHRVFSNRNSSLMHSKLVLRPLFVFHLKSLFYQSNQVYLEQANPR